MVNLKDLLIPSINAQGDATAQPTFGEIDVGGGGISGGTVFLNADKTSVEVGDIVTVTLRIQTNDVLITEYRVAVDFNPQQFTVVDNDPTTNGTQVSILDTIFEVDQETGNTVAAAGRVRVEATSPEETPLAVNSEVIQIQFQAQTTGTATIEIAEGATGTQLIRSNGNSIGFTTNSITIDTQQQASTDGNGDANDDQGQDNGGSNGAPVPPVTDGNNNGTDQPEIPATAVPEELVAPLGVLIGVLFVLLGVSLTMNRTPKKK